MDDQLEAVIREIAAVHGIAVSPDDPILILQTMNNRLLSNSAKAQEELLGRFKEELELAAFRWQSDARTKSERLLNVALEAASATMAQSMVKSAEQAAETLRNENEKIVIQLTVPVRDAKRIAFYNLIASSMTLVAAVIIVWVVFR